MENHQHTIGTGVYIGFQVAETQLPRRTEGLKRVLLAMRGKPAVGERYRFSFKLPAMCIEQVGIRTNARWSHEHAFVSQLQVRSGD